MERGSARALKKVALIAGFVGALALSAPAQAPPAPPAQSPATPQTPAQTPVRTPPVAAGAVREITVRGNARVARDTILAFMRLKVGQPFSQSAADDDEKSLADTGFFSAVKVTGTPAEGEAWIVTVDVSEFPEIKEIQVIGNKAVPTDDILKVVELKPGDVFNLKAQKPSADAIQKLYSNRGYFGIVTRLEPSTESPGTVTIEIIEGVVGSVTVTGNTATKKRVIERLVRTRPGDTFNAEKWQRDLSRLYNTRYFENVQNRSVEGFRDGNKIDLVAAVTEARTGVFNVGVTLDPRNSLAGIFSIADTNFRGTGQSVALNYTQATIGQGASASLSYTNPFIDRQNTTLRAELYSRLNFRFANTGFGTGNNTPTSDRYTERRTGGSLGLQRPAGTFDTLGISGRAESVRTSDLGTSTSNNFIQQDGDLVSVALTAITNHRDVDVDPSRGYFARFDVEPGNANITKVGGLANSTNTILGQNFFTKFSFDGRSYLTRQPPRRRSLVEPRRVLAFWGRGGTIAGNVPFFEQFFVGGSDSIRGYPEDRFWGKNYFVGTGEYRQPVSDSISVVSFLDYGGAWGGFGTVNNFTQSSSPRFQVGYGLGVRVRTPIGPIRLDYGLNGQGGSRAHFSIATSF